MNLSQILNYAEKNNCQTETNFAHSYICPITRRYEKPESISIKHIQSSVNRETQNWSYVGIQIKTRWSTQFYWFVNYDLSDSDFWHFEHIYNQNTGQTIRGWKKASQLMNKMQKLSK